MAICGLSFGANDKKVEWSGLRLPFTFFKPFSAVPVLPQTSQPSRYASLIEEMYLTDTIMRPEMIDQVKAFTPNYSSYDRKQQKYDAKRNKK